MSELGLLPELGPRSRVICLARKLFPAVTKVDGLPPAASVCESCLGNCKLPQHQGFSIRCDHRLYAHWPSCNSRLFDRSDAVFPLNPSPAFPLAQVGSSWNWAVAPGKVRRTGNYFFKS
eukprot:8140412-Pyramimonas_sp.AAC.1